jgi:hypothetical protein
MASRSAKIRLRNNVDKYIKICQYYILSITPKTMAEKTGGGGGLDAYGKASIVRNGIELMLLQPIRLITGIIGSAVEMVLGK